MENSHDIQYEVLWINITYRCEIQIKTEATLTAKMQLPDCCATLKGQMS